MQTWLLQTGLIVICVLEFDFWQANMSKQSRKDDCVLFAFYRLSSLRRSDTCHVKEHTYVETCHHTYAYLLSSNLPLQRSLQKYPGSPQSPRMSTLHQGTQSTSPAGLRETQNRRSSGSVTSKPFKSVRIMIKHFKCAAMQTIQCLIMVCPVSTAMLLTCGMTVV